MGNKGKSVPKLFGNGYDNYDEHGHKIGETRRKAFGNGYNHYDQNGKKIGETHQGFLGGYNTYDNNGKKISHTDRGFGDSYVTRDQKGNKTVSNRTILGDYSHSEGCYIATCVYGAYDAPEVLVLRKFRDEVLLKHLFGKLFVKFYYSVSPKVVKLFGKNQTFRRFWRKILNKIVLHLQK